MGDVGITKDRHSRAGTRKSAEIVLEPLAFERSLRCTRQDALPEHVNGDPEKMCSDGADVMQLYVDTDRDKAIPIAKPLQRGRDVHFGTGHRRLDAVLVSEN